MKLSAAIVRVNNWSTFSRPCSMTWRMGPIVLPQPKHCSIRVRSRRLTGYPACRVVRPSIALPPLRLVFC